MSLSVQARAEAAHGDPPSISASFHDVQEPGEPKSAGHHSWKYTPFRRALSRTKWEPETPAKACKLQMLDAAQRLDDLRLPPGNRLELLKGDRTGRHSIRITNQWQICFSWRDGEASDVEIVDDHRGY